MDVSSLSSDASTRLCTAALSAQGWEELGVLNRSLSSEPCPVHTLSVEQLLKQWAALGADVLGTLRGQSLGAGGEVWPVTRQAPSTCCFLIPEGKGLWSQADWGPRPFPPNTSPGAPDLSHQTLVQGPEHNLSRPEISWSTKGSESKSRTRP